MSRERWILHADMDAFYASVEQRDDPALKGKPVIVGGKSDRGVVSAASYEARKFGVRSAMPAYEAKRRCPEGVFLAGDMKKYAAVSKKLHKIFGEFTDQIEPLALDEAFLDIGGSVPLFGPPLEIGKLLKTRVREQLDLVVSVGIAPNKLVAKVACSAGKPDGLLLIEECEVRALLDPLPVRALWGVGPKAETRLKNVHIRTIKQIANGELSLLRAAFGNHAEAMKKRAQGFDDRPVESTRVAHSIGEEATFVDNVTSEERISAAITAHAEKVASRARRVEMRGQTLTLKVKLARRKSWGSKIVSNHELFPVVSRQIRLKEATFDGTEMRRIALELWKKMALSEPIRLVGVSLSDLKPVHDPRQLGLFDLAPKSIPKKPRADMAAAGQSTTRAEALGKTLDAISDKFGEGSIGRAVGNVQKIAHSDRIKLGEKEDP